MQTPWLKLQTSICHTPVAESATTWELSTYTERNLRAERDAPRNGALTTPSAGTSELSSRASLLNYLGTRSG